MAKRFKILHLQFELPEAFSVQTEKYVFEVSPFEFTARLEVIPAERRADPSLEQHYKKWLEGSYDSVELVEDTENARGRILRGQAEASSGDLVPRPRVRRAGRR